MQVALLQSNSSKHLPLQKADPRMTGYSMLHDLVVYTTPIPGLKHCLLAPQRRFRILTALNLSDLEPYLQRRGGRHLPGFDLCCHYELG